MATSPPLTASLNYTIGFVAAYGKEVGAPLTLAQIQYQLSHYYESKVGNLIAGTVVMIVASSVAVAMRLMARRVKHAKLGADDYMAISGLILFYGYVTSFFVVIHYGLGTHTLRAGAYKFAHVGKPFYVFQCLYPAVCFTTKMSVLLLYRRVFTVTNRAYDISFWIIMFVFVSWAIANFFKDVFEAVPVKAVWELTPGAKWIDPIQAFFITGIINVIITTAILILPMPVVWKIQLSLGKRIGICALFALGCGDVVVIIARTVLLKLETYPSTDFTWTVTPTAILSIVEQALGILCASLPMAGRLLYRRFNTQKDISDMPMTNQQTSGATSTRSSNKNKGLRKISEQAAIPDLERAKIYDDRSENATPEGPTFGERTNFSKERPQLAQFPSRSFERPWNPLGSHTFAGKAI